MKNITFFIHVPWKWIKQRPHFIAEGLSNKYDVTVCENYPFSKQFRGGRSDKVKVKTYPQLPKDRVRLIHWLNKILLHASLKRQLKEADYIWITNPFQYALLNENDKQAKKVVYDCMDDLPEFEPTLERRKKLETVEFSVYAEADIIIASSEYLKGKLIQRYGERNVYVVNNAIKNISSDEIKPLSPEVKDKMPQGRFIITYIGTIERWIDMNLVMEIIHRNPEVDFCFFGPLRVELPQHERIHYCGMVPHEMVFSVMDHSDTLIMPFVLNELILSVNPVKLYEYIYSGKPCLAPRYGESESFGEYTYLYESSDECCSIIEELVRGMKSKHTVEESRSFAMQNTWQERVEQIEKLLG